MDRRQDGWVAIQPDTEHNRVYWIDVLRGIAILLMIPANMAPYMGEPHPMLYRFLGSFAAPLFIMLSAGMVVLRADKHSLGYYVQRGLYVLLCGVALDTLLWNILPFTSFDVLYTIGIGMIAVYLLRNIEYKELTTIAVIIFLAAYVLLQLFGYHETVLEVYYLEDRTLPSFGRLLQSWFIDGWFPLFPWLGFALIGAAFFKYLHEKKDQFSIRTVFIAGLILFAVGLILLLVPISHFENFASGQIIENRDGYSEIFYPPTPGYILLSVGFFLILLRVVYFSRPNALGDFISFFGRYSMLAYIAHQVIGVAFIDPILGVYGVEQIEIGWFFTVANIVVIALVYFVCLIASYTKRHVQIRNIFLQVLIGK